MGVSESQGLVYEYDGYIGQCGSTVQDSGDIADPLRGITIIADTCLSTRCGHPKAFGPHGCCYLHHSSHGGIEIRLHLVHAGYNDHLFRAKCHGIGAVTYTIHIDYLSSGRDGIGAAQEAIAAALLEANIQIHPRALPLLPVIKNSPSHGFHFIEDPDSPGGV